MKVSMVCENSLPMSTGGGPRMNQWAVVEELRQRGHNVQVIFITTQPGIDLNTAIGIQALQNRGTYVVPASYAESSPAGVARVLGAFQPDVIFSLGTWGISWAAAYDQAVPRVVMLGDPEHIIGGYRRQLKNPEPMTYEEIATLHNAGVASKKAYLDVLVTCTAAFCGAAHSTEWFRGQGFNVEYVPMPVVEPAYLGWRRRLENMPQNEKPRILMAGHLGGIATLSSLYYLVDEVLPNMEDIDQYDWRVCGGDSLQTDLVNRFKKYPQVKFMGYVEDIRREMLECDIFLCTTSSTCGVRTRIAEALAMGLCIIAHSANAVGQPELEDDENVLLANSGKDIASHIRYMAHAPEERHRFGIAARETYEAKFRTELSAGRIIDVMEELTNGN